jgi:hypothetical protein
MERRTFLFLSAGAATGALLSACGGSAEDHRPPPPNGPIPPPAPATENVALAWNRTALEAIRQVRPGPPMAARSLAIVHSANERHRARKPVPGGHA